MGDSSGSSPSNTVDVAIDGGATTPLNEANHDEIRKKHDAHTRLHLSHRAPVLRAGILGANDGLVSVAAVMVGVGGGDVAVTTLLLSGLAALIGGALSMAAGEYVSVAGQRDCEEADIEKERHEQSNPAAKEKELQELAEIYILRGLGPDLAMQVAKELTKQDAIRAHCRDELGIDVDDLANPLSAAVTSAFSFLIGAGIPLLTAYLVHLGWGHTTVLVSVVISVSVTLALSGYAGAALGGSKPWRGTARVVIGGWLAMAVTFGIGKLLSVTGSV